MKTRTLNKIKSVVVNIPKLEKRGTPKGDAQREEFKKRWGVYPHEL